MNCISWNLYRFHLLFQDITDARIQEGADFLLEDVEEEDMVANVVEELAGAGAVAKKAVRRLSFSNGGSEPKKLKISSGTAKEQRRMSGKPIGEKNKPVSKTTKAGLVFSISRVHKRLRENRYVSRVRFLLIM